MIPDDLLKEIKDSKGIKKVNEKLVESAYKEAVAADENLSSLKIKLWLLSKNGDWVEAGTWAFSLDKLENIADFVRDIVLSNIEDVANFVVNGTITVKYRVIDETTGDIKLQNTIKIVVPKEALKRIAEERVEIVKEKVEEGIWDGLEKFIELNKKVLDTAIQAKEIEKESLVSIFKQQIELVNTKIKELQEKLLKGELKGDDKALVIALSFMEQLQKLREEYEKKLFELLSKQFEMQAKIQEEKMKHEKEKMVETVTRLQEELKKMKPEGDEATKLTYKILQELIETALKRTIENDPIKEVKEIASLLKELKSGEDIKEELSKTVLELTKKKISEDPLQDLATKLKLLKEVYATIEGDKEKVKEELRREIEELKQLIMMQQMQQQDFLPREQEEDPLEKLEKEADRLARIYQRLEKLFGKREPVSKSLVETVKEILSSPTIVKIIEVLGTTMLQAEQMKMQMMYMQPYPHYGAMPMTSATPANRVKKVVKRKKIVRQVPQINPNIQIPTQAPSRQSIPQQTTPQPEVNMGSSSSNNMGTPQAQAPQEQGVEELKKEINETLESQLVPIIEEWKKNKKRGGVKLLKKRLVSKVIDIERESAIIARTIMAGDMSLLAELKNKIDKILEEKIGIPSEEAQKLADEIISEVANILTQGEKEG